MQLPLSQHHHAVPEHVRKRLVDSGQIRLARWSISIPASEVRLPYHL
jgi:hypothetical protein